MDRGLLDARALVGHLVPGGSMFWFLATHRGELFPDEEFADLFPSGRGRPARAAILTLQTLHDLSDAETAEAARCDLRWKVAVGMALDDAGFHPSTLTYWRQRLARSARPHRVNEAVKRVVGRPGSLLAGGGGRWTPRSWPMRPPPRTPSPSWSRRSGGWLGRCPARPPRSRRCARGMTTPPRASRRLTGRTRPPRTRWCRRWSTTQARWLRRSPPPSWTSGPRPRWRCWRWSPAKTWTRPKARMGPTGAGGPPARSPPTA